MRRADRSTLVLIWVLLWATPTFADEASDAYKRGDFATALRLWRPVAEKGNAIAQYIVGFMYANGQGLPKDDAQANAWFRKAADQGHAAAQHGLAVMYSNGRGGLPKDDAQAAVWYRKAADQGHAAAQNNLGHLYEDGRGGLPKDDAQALAWYRKAADQGDANAQTSLGAFYVNGRGGLPKDDAQVVAWSRKAAEQGHANAQNSLGLMYANGRGGLPKDDAQALAWFRKAADQGNAAGQNSLGVMYADGRGGLSKDHVQALAWYLKAAEQGNATAQTNIGEMYEKGQGGLPKDNVQALAWYRKAADQGIEHAKNAISRLQESAVQQQAATQTRSPTGSKPAAPATGPRQLTLGPQHALIIGNKKYQYLKPLITPHNDADAVKRTLLRYGFDEKNITLIVDAKRSDITRALSSLRAQLTDKDNLLIYYAGHGRQDNSTDRGYWLPVDAEPDNEANWISNDDITNYLKAMRARSVLIVSDSCFSGTLTRDGGMGEIRVGGEEEWVRRMATKRSRTALTSGGLEPVMDAGGGAHSVFAKAFLDVLQENNQLTTMDNLFQQIKKRVVVNARQTPGYSTIKYAEHDHGDFVFAPR